MAEKIEGAVRSLLEGSGKKDIVIVHLVDLHPPSASIEGSRAEKAQAVHDSKVANAEASQKELVALLQGKGLQFKSFWINNSIAVEADWALVQEIAALASVKQIAPNQGGAHIMN